MALVDEDTIDVVGPGDTFVITKAITFVAHWALAGATTYSVIYDDNGADSGDVPIDPNSYTEGQSAMILSNSGSLLKSGFSFGGWNTEADGSGVRYSVGAVMTIPAANVTLYAQWVESYSGEIKLYLEGGFDMAFEAKRGGNQILTPGADSDTVDIGAGQKAVMLFNAGANVCHVRIGNSITGTPATTADTPVPPGMAIIVRKATDEDTLSHISDSGTILHVQPGEIY